MNNGTVSHLDNATTEFRAARDHAVVGAAEAVTAGIEVAREAGGKVGDRYASVKGRGLHLVEEASDAIGSRPWATIGIALAAGYVLAKVSSRS